MCFYCFKIIVFNQIRNKLSYHHGETDLRQFVNTVLCEYWSLCMDEIVKKEPLTFQRPSRFSHIFSVLDVWLPKNPCGAVGRKKHTFWRQIWIKT